MSLDSNESTDTCVLCLWFMFYVVPHAVGEGNAMCTDKSHNRKKPSLQANMTISPINELLAITQSILNKRFLAWPLTIISNIPVK